MTNPNILIDDFDIATDKMIEKEHFTEESFRESIRDAILNTIGEFENIDDIVNRAIICPKKTLNEATMKSALEDHRKMYENGTKSLKEYAEITVGAAEYFGCLEG